jgi:hypothetical protein
MHPLEADQTALQHRIVEGAVADLRRGQIGLNHLIAFARPLLVTAMVALTERSAAGRTAGWP